MAIIKADPSNIDAWIELGTVAWELEDFHRVAQCSLRVIALAPDRFEGYMLKGINERHHGKLDDAVTLFRQAADRSAGSALPHVLLGLTLEERGEIDGALAAYRAAVDIDPKNQEAMKLEARLAASRRVSSVDPGS